MKKILLVDMNPTLRSYVTKKLHDAGIFVLYAHNFNIAFEYLQKSTISLVIIDHNRNRDTLFDFFEKKRLSKKIETIPCILFANEISKTEKALLVSYHVKKTFSMPVPVDSFFSSLKELLDITIEFDTTPCVLQTRVSKNLIVVELAQGLNRTKIELLSFILEELIQLHELDDVKVLVILTDMELNFTAVANLEFLVDTILSVNSIEKDTLKFLTLNSFAIEFFNDNPHYNNVEVVSTFSDAVSALISGNEDEKLEVMDSLLQAGTADVVKKLCLDSRFQMDIPKSWKFAVVDDDPVICKTIESVFTGKAEVDSYLGSKEFLDKFIDTKYDIVFLDMVMPEIDGIDVLRQLKKSGAKTPFIVLSSVQKREVILESLQSGAKKYLLKPVNKETIISKTKEILGDAF